jgi:hypothetical protein
MGYRFVIEYWIIPEKNPPPSFGPLQLAGVISQKFRTFFRNFPLPSLGEVLIFFE